MIRPVFANTASVATRRGLLLRGGGWGKITLRVRCGLIVHPEQGPMLMDAGYGPRAASAAGRSLALRAYAAAIRFQIHAEQSPLALIRAHGFAPNDIKRIFVSHLHADHVAYLQDFPEARFVVNGPVRGSLRHAVFPELLPEDFAARSVQMADMPEHPLPFDMGQGADLLGDGSLLGVSLPGHARGHYGIVCTGSVPLLYGFDTQWLLPAVLENRIPGFPASLVAEEPSRVAESADFMRRFAQAGGEVMLCHDPEETPYDWSGDV